jgi:ribonuclease HII
VDMRKISEEKLALERQRLEGMREFENKYSDLGAVAGIDEAGRGPLAGPVVAAAVILPKDIFLPFLNDSKKVTEKRRDVLFDQIKQEAIAYGIGIASNALIDEINILQATYEAMREAISKLNKTPDILLVDAVHIPGISIKQVGIVKGDAKSVNIAAASILAKVTRDRLMLEYDKIYPEYGFASNKGYGTAKHIEALKAYGACDIHRRSFIGNFVGE